LVPEKASSGGLGGAAGVERGVPTEEEHTVPTTKNMAVQGTGIRVSHSDVISYRPQPDEPRAPRGQRPGAPMGYDRVAYAEVGSYASKSHVWAHETFRQSHGGHSVHTYSFTIGLVVIG
jgi:hypothetical protein